MLTANCYISIQFGCGTQAKLEAYAVSHCVVCNGYFTFCVSVYQLVVCVLDTIVNCPYWVLALMTFNCWSAVKQLITYLPFFLLKWAAFETLRRRWTSMSKDQERNCFHVSRPRPWTFALKTEYEEGSLWRNVGLAAMLNGASNSRLLQTVNFWYNFYLIYLFYPIYLS